MVVNLLQNNGFTGAVHTLCIVSVIGQDKSRLGHYRCLEFRQGKAEVFGNVLRLAIRRTRHLRLTIVAEDIHQFCIRQR